VHGSQWSEAHAHAVALNDDVGGKLVHPYEDVDTWTGHATVVHEIKSDLAAMGVETPPAAIVTCVGGGGLLAGILQGLAEVGWGDEEAALARAFHRRYPHPPRPLPRPPRDASEGTCALNSRRRPDLSSGACTPQSRRRREVCGTRSSVSSEPPPPPPSPPPPSRASPPTSPSSSSRRRTSACPGDATHRGSSSRVHAAGSRKGSDADAP
jgi:hypothetical protein